MNRLTLVLLTAALLPFRFASESATRFLLAAVVVAFNLLHWYYKRDDLYVITLFANGFDDDIEEVS